MYSTAKPQQIIAPYQIYLKERILSEPCPSSSKGCPVRRIVRTTGCTTPNSFLRYLIRIANTANASKIKRLATLIHLHVPKLPRPVLTSPTATKPPTVPSPTPTEAAPMTSPTTTENPLITSPNITETPSLETIPAELRKIIFSYCCSHDAGDICPIPTDYEICTLLRDGRKLPKKPNLFAQGPSSSLISYNRYDSGWPAVALMGVSHQIRDEVLPILFGMNTWRFSYQWTPPANADQVRAFKQICYFFQLQYSKYFRNVSCQFNAQDVPQECLVIRLRTRPLHSNSSWDMMSGEHNKNLDLLINEPMREKIWRINQMENLDRLYIGLGSLACPGGCCRSVVLKKFINYWKSEMNNRLGKWGPTFVFKRCTERPLDQAGRKGEVSRVYIKGEKQKQKLLAVYGLWSKKEGDNLLKHWLTPVNKTAQEPSKETFDAFLADLEAERPSVGWAMTI